jgi:hypothetical protein
MTKVNNVLSQDFKALFDQLLSTRVKLETLQRNHGPLNERADHLERLHTLRAELATARQSTSL